MLRLSAKSLKVTVVLDPAALVGITVPDGQPKFPISLAAGGHVLQADLNAKSLRRCIAAIGEAAPDGVAVVLQGRLEGEVILDAGISAQPRAPKVAAA